jgi:NIPSNAP protein/TAT (twin-arginine translocation) pathway-exported protein
MKNLNRRDFLKTSLAASATAALASMPAPARAADAPAAGGQYFEIRAYRLRPGAPHALLDSYLEKAFIPALNARGVEAVGVFTEPEAKDGPAVWVLIPHPSLESVGSVDATLNADPAVLAAGADYLSSPTKEQPAFDRIDSWLLLPFSGLPRLAVPALAREGKPRIFEMRTYESFSELKALKKVAMFNAGEIGVMQEVDLSPVFYGEALMGRDLPHLTYMLCSADMATHKKNWDRFLAHPVWTGLKNDPQYADTVQKITSRFLVPAAYSQI